MDQTLLDHVSLSVTASHLVSASHSETNHHSAIVSLSVTALHLETALVHLLVEIVGADHHLAVTAEADRRSAIANLSGIVRHSEIVLAPHLEVIAVDVHRLETVVAVHHSVIVSLSGNAIVSMIDLASAEVLDHHSATVHHATIRERIIFPRMHNVV